MTQDVRTRSSAQGVKTPARTTQGRVRPQRRMVGMVPLRPGDGLLDGMSGNPFGVEDG